MARRGHDVTVANPLATPESARFESQGGHFVNAGIETLPTQPGFDVVSEDFPVPIRKVLAPAEAMAAERISRLEPGGVWIIATESDEFVGMLQYLGQKHGAQVTANEIPRYHEATPDSPHAIDPKRYIVTIQRPGTPESGPPATPGESSTLPKRTGDGRATQLGKLFIPKAYAQAGEAPTYAEQQAAHRALFTADNQPAEGVERVSPNYPPPPATPAQITAIQNEIVNLLASRALAEQEAQRESARAGRCEDNQGPIAASLQSTAAGISAVRAHDEAIARHEAVNQEQQRRQQESQGIVAGYPSRATGLAALTVPLQAWESFTDIASHLPGEAGDKMLQMNADARKMQEAFAQMGENMLGVDGAGPSNRGNLLMDNGRLEVTGRQSKASNQELLTTRGAQGEFRSANSAALKEAANARDTATGHAQQFGDA